MRIGIEIYYKLYHSTLDLQIEKAKEDIEIFRMTFKNIKDILKSYKPYIDTQVNILYGILLISPSTLVKGKLSERYVYEDKVYTKELFFDYLRAYKKNFDRLNQHKAYIKSLERKRIEYKIYKLILKKFNSKISSEIVFNRYTFNLGYNLGSLFLTHKRIEKEMVDWGKSDKKKAEIKERGGTPYYKEDAEEAEKYGEEYVGEKWLVMHPKDGVWVHHRYGTIKGYKLKLITSSSPFCITKQITELRNSEGFNVNSYPFIKQIQR